MAKRHPYQGRPDYQFWRKEPGIQDSSAFDPVKNSSFKINMQDKIVTAGSCFAQHVARHLSNSGFNFFITEPIPDSLDSKAAKNYHYGLFSARYGNLYTARQLRQLLLRAWGNFDPIEYAWQLGEDSWIDPFRPQIQPGGFFCEQELRLDRATHLAAVREAILSMDVFVFTLGLTEAWHDLRDGAVYPIAPGVAGGTYDPAIHGFHNFSVEETASDLLESIAFIRAVNPAVKFVITVSPVPLNATAVDRHVFVSTTYSKAVLRIAAEQVCQATTDCDYFPSYEIITSPMARGAYFGPDCREVMPQGVDHVMSLFLKHYTSSHPKPSERQLATSSPLRSSAQAALDLLCDEEAINNEE